MTVILLSVLLAGGAYGGGAYDMSGSFSGIASGAWDLDGNTLVLDADGDSKFQFGYTDAIDIILGGVSSFILYKTGYLSRMVPGNDNPALALSLRGGNAYKKATGTNRAGADLRLSGGLGSRVIDIDNVADSNGDTLTFTFNGTPYVFTFKNPGPEVDTTCTDGACDVLCITDAPTCATSLSTRLVSVAGTSIAVGTGGDTDKVYVSGLVTSVIAESMNAAITNSAGAVVGTATNNTDGNVMLGQSTSTGAKLCMTSDCWNYIWASSGLLGLYSVNTMRIRLTTEVAVYNSALNMNGGSIYDSTDELSLGTAAEGTVATATGDAIFGGKLEIAGNAFRMARIEAAAPAEPVACGATTVGTHVYVNDTDDGARAEVCACHGITNDATYDWVKATDYTAACPFF